MHRRWPMGTLHSNSHVHLRCCLIESLYNELQEYKHTELLVELDVVCSTRAYNCIMNSMKCVIILGKISCGDFIVCAEHADAIPQASIPNSREPQHVFYNIPL